MSRVMCARNVGVQQRLQRQGNVGIVIGEER